MFTTTQLYLEILNCKDDVIVLQGGTAAGKTYAALQALFSYAVQSKEVITVVGQDIPNLKVGALRDALDIYNNSEEFKQLFKTYKKSDRIFEFTSGSIMEFKSFDDYQDAKSGKRDRLFVNEANGISYPIYTELAMRTKKQIIIDYNPNAEFWVHEHLLGKQDVSLFITDHRHNPFITDKVRNKIEALKDIDIELWRVYARGKTGKVEGIIFRNWERTFIFPLDSKFIAYGLDFGFTNDPTALIEVRMQDGHIYVKELIYETGLTNQDISARMKQLGVDRDATIIADIAEPKSIEELRRMGWQVEEANNGRDKKLYSIDILKRYKIFVVGGSYNLARELMGYRWRTDKISGKSINDPIDKDNHAIDALRYVALNRLGINNSGEYYIY
jgi:phage terminase large subunit